MNLVSILKSKLGRMLFFIHTGLIVVALAGIFLYSKFINPEGKLLFVFLLLIDQPMSKWFLVITDKALSASHQFGLLSNWAEATGHLISTDWFVPYACFISIFLGGLQWYLIGWSIERFFGLLMRKKGANED